MTIHWNLFARNWIRVIILMIAGALIGYWITQWLPPRYTAIADIAISIDYNQTGALSDIQEDRMVGITEDIIKSDLVLEALCSATIAEEICTPASLWTSLRLQRTNDRWVLLATSDSAESAATLVQQWAKLAHAALTRAHQSALQEHALKATLERITQCLEQAPNTNRCALTMNEILNWIPPLTTDIQQAQEKSRGLSAAMIIGALNSAGIEVRAATGASGWLTFAGMGLGLVISLLWMILAEILPMKLRKG